MAMSFSELRGMIYDESFLGRLSSKEDNQHLITLDEVAAEFLNEAFYGRKTVAPMQDAMNKVREAYLRNPNINMTKAPENKALEAAIMKCFGFKSCTVYWVNLPDISRGPFTVPMSHIYGVDGAYIKMGENVNGMYDRDHKIKVAISSDLVLFDEPYKLTSEEMVGIFLHEIGHNFDYTTFGLLRQWEYILQQIIDAIKMYLSGDFFGGLGATAGIGIAMVMKNSPDFMVKVLNINDIVINVIPSIGEFTRSAGKFVRPVKQLVDVIINQISWATTIPKAIMLMPVRLVSNIFLRKGEVYADSFSAAYGYASEQISALQKLSSGRKTTDMNLGPVSEVFNDLSLLQYEVYTTVLMGHGSTQQRGLRMLDTFNQDLEKADLSASDKAAIIKERDRVLETYNQFVSMSNEQRSVCTKLYRTLVDGWYKGQSSVLPELNKNYVD